MADDDKAQKTEPATPKRKEESRRKGQVVQSKEVQTVVVLGCTLLVASSEMGSALMRQVSAILQASFSASVHPPSTLGDYQALLNTYSRAIGSVLLPMIVTTAAVATASQVAIVGPLFSPEALTPKASRMSLISGIKRFVDKDRAVELVKAFFKVGIVSLVTWWTVRGEIDHLLGLNAVDPSGQAGAIAGTVGRVAVAVVATLAVMAIFDQAYQQFRYDERLRMSKQDIRDELKQAEGDPQMRGRYRERARELSRSRMISAVAEADVVVTNPTHFAVALRYDRTSMAAPKVLAKGRGHVALRIREVAGEHKVPIVENPPLARLLHKSCEVGREIPDKLFAAVAEVLATVYRLDAARARRMQEARP